MEPFLSPLHSYLVNDWTENVPAQIIVVTMMATINTSRSADTRRLPKVLAMLAEGGWSAIEAEHGHMWPRMI